MGRRRNLTPNEINEIVERVESGDSYKSIAMDLGISDNTVRVNYKKYWYDPDRWKKRV